MTAEIAIMNKHAVALAADSAVTIGSEQKIYNTNKLFMLSKYHPIGVMIYGNAELLGIPWETAIKSYRHQLGEKYFSSVQQYGDDLVRYLERSRRLFPVSEQEQWAHREIRQVLGSILDGIHESVKQLVAASTAISPKELKSIVKLEIEAFHQVFSSVDYVPQFTAARRRTIERDLSPFIGKMIRGIFQKLPLTKLQRGKLKEISLFAIVKGINSGERSGLVVAGFGEDDVYPSVCPYEIQGMIANKLKYRLGMIQTVASDNPGIVFPFAQSEMVYTFMEGMDPSLEKHMQDYLKELLTGVHPEQVAAAVPGLSQKERDRLKAQLATVGKTLLSDFNSNFSKKKRIENVHPIVEAVTFLPKEELASMAESLVNLTSFKRRVTLVSETVGGPIDVAVISKGDGFVWVKRKHYFDNALNPHFQANYYSDRRR